MKLVHWQLMGGLFVTFGTIRTKPSLSGLEHRTSCPRFNARRSHSGALTSRFRQRLRVWVSYSTASWLLHHTSDGSPDSGRCFYHLRQLKTVRRSLTEDAAKSLVGLHAFVTSRIDYCNNVIYGARAAHIQPLQNAAARLILHKRKYDHITSDIRDRLHWLPIQQRLEYKICLLIFKCLHQKAPVYLAAMSDPVSASACRSHLRSAVRTRRFGGTSVTNDDLRTKKFFPSLVRHCGTRCRSLFVTHLWQWRSSAHIWRLFCFAKHIVLGIAPSWQLRL